MHSRSHHMQKTPASPLPKFLRSLAQAWPLLALAACGGNGSSSATSETAPGAPTLNSATAGDGQATLAFTASTSGGAASSYTGKCSTSAVTGTSSPITITGLT